ncbi:gp154 [Synechococcus phage S-CBM2]|nr:gp154 [Synechococcus phage S-CBM2]
MHNWKYNEENLLNEMRDYISATYSQHYSADNVQTLDLIAACGDGESFCRSNILKYASRYDKKGSARRDIMKILHYALLLLYFNDQNAQREEYPNR